ACLNAVDNTATMALLRGRFGRPDREGFHGPSALGYVVRPSRLRSGGLPRMGSRRIHPESRGTTRCAVGRPLRIRRERRALGWRQGPRQPCQTRFDPGRGPLYFDLWRGERRRLRQSEPAPVSRAAAGRRSGDACVENRRARQRHARGNTRIRTRGETARIRRRARPVHTARQLQFRLVRRRRWARWLVRAMAAAVTQNLARGGAGPEAGFDFRLGQPRVLLRIYLGGSPQRALHLLRARPPGDGGLVEAGREEPHPRPRLA